MNFSMITENSATNNEKTYITKPKFHLQTYNNANVHFNRDELDLLNKELKHNLQSDTNSTKQIRDEILDLKTAI